MSSYHMKTTDTDVSSRFSEQLAIAIETLKERLRVRYERIFPGKSRMIDQALEEAESIAWCTAFPHLFLPELAEARIAEFAPR